MNTMTFESYRNTSLPKSLKVSMLLFLLVMVQFAHAQKGYVAVRGKVRKGNNPEASVNIAISAPGAPAQTVASEMNGTYMFSLELQKNYTIVFSKDGLVTKTIIFNTVVPADEADIIFENEFNMDLFEDVAGVSQNASMSKPVAKIAYNPTYEDFVHDATYSRQIQSEQMEARKAAEELKRQQEKARLDSLNKVWNDSLARVKDREEKLMLLRAEQDKARKDSLEKAQQRAKLLAAAEAAEKARQDSISRAQNELLRQQEIARNREKARQDSLARVQQEKSRLDSLAAVRAAAEAKEKAEAEAKVREQARKDSLASVAKAEAERKQRDAEMKIKLELAAKQRADSISRAEADRKQREADEKMRIELAAKQRADSLSKAETALKLRQQAVADSIARANAELERRQAEARKQQEMQAKERAKFVKDSTDMADKAAKDRAKYVADSTSFAQAAQEQKRLRMEADAKAREKVRQDSINLAVAAEKQKNIELAKQREKARQDSLANAENQRLLMLAEAKRKDDEAKAAAAALAKADAEAREKAEADRQRLAMEEKAKQDSISRAQKDLAEREEAERKAKAMADIEAKKQQLSKSSELPDTKVTGTTAKVAPVPKIVSADYHEGVTEEKVSESNRTIYRVVIKKDGAVYNYQKVVYSWGVYYFKNETPITQTTYEQDIKNAKASMPK